MPDIPGNNTTTATISVGGTVSSTLETLGDHDWFRITLTAGQSITVFVDGTTLEDSYLYIRNAAGTVIFENDDITSGIDRDSRLSFSAPSSGTYYIDVGSFDESYTGDYQVSVSVYTPPPLATYDQIANQLVEGYWGGDDHHFNVSQGGSITVDITDLTPAGQTLARAALAEWSDIIGVNFVEVSSGAQITFDDNQSGAATDSNWSGGIISSSHVNVSTQWLATYGTALNSYSFQTYIHEIGHALGLGHAGNYNGTASYPYDASFQNDAWVTSIMSYFDQTDNTYFAGQGFSKDFVVTPMIADIVAMSTLYGLSTITRTGDTTYGFNSNAGRIAYDASLNPGVAYTIFDSGGNDTVNYSLSSNNQLINLNAETFSNVGSGVGNLSIGRGVVIENAVGGSGNDTLIGNAVANVLAGNAGNDALDGGGGSDTASYADAISGVTVSLAIAGAQNTFGAGTDTLTSIENLIGSAFNDTLTGNGGANVLEGGAGSDALNGGAGSDTASYASAGSGVTVSLALMGAQDTVGAGSDTLIGIENLTGSGFNDTLTGDGLANVLDGGAGSDTASYASAGSGVTVSLALAGSQATGGAGSDTLSNIENLTGSGFADNLTGDAANNVLNGGAGADVMAGGAGDDIYVVDQAGDAIVEGVGGGVDMLVAKASYALGSGVSIETMTTINASATTAIILTGNEFGQSLYGNAGDNILIGLGGSDYLVGGLGNDKYYVDTADFITEANGGGDDWIFVPDTYILREGTEIETLVAVNQDSLDAVNLTGNEYGQSLYGSQGANSLNGGAGNDYLVGLGGNDFLLGGLGNDNMAGGQGNDIYYADSLGDWVIEAAGEGDDTVVAFASFALRAGESVETLAAAEGTSAINLTGNELAQSIYGNAGANVITSNGGADYLVGGGGNDVFVLSNAAITSPGPANISTIADYAAGDIIDVSPILAVGAGTNVTAGGYLRVTSGGQVQVDVNGGGDGYVTVGNVNGSGSVTLRYLSGGIATDLSVARSGQASMGQTSMMTGAVAAAGMAALVPGDSTSEATSGDHLAASATAAPAAGIAGTPDLALTDGGSPAPLAHGTFAALDDAAPMSFASILGRDAALTQPAHPLAVHEAAAPVALDQGTTLAAATPATQALVAQGLVSAGIVMPSAEQLLALAHTQLGAADHAEPGPLAQVLHEALAEGAGSPIDALLAALPAEAAATAIDHLAAAADTGHALGVFGDAHGAFADAALHPAFALETLALHPDAPAVA